MRTLSTVRFMWRVRLAGARGLALKTLALAKLGGNLLDLGEFGRAEATFTRFHICLELLGGGSACDDASDDLARSEETISEIKQRAAALLRHRLQLLQSGP